MKIDNELFVCIINLDRRPDRKLQMEAWLKNLEVDLNWISATDARMQNYETRFGLRNDEAACWQSHQSAYRAFLNSTKKIALILEDDALPINTVSIFESKLQKILKIVLKNKINIMQIGYSFKIPILSKAKFKFLRRYVKLDGEVFAVNDFQPGCHAYLVSRKAAQDLIGLNDPAYLAADAFLNSVAWQAKMTNYGFYRLKKSLVGQSSVVNGIIVDSDIQQLK